MDTVSSPRFVSREAAFLATLGNLADTRFYVVPPSGANHSHVIKDRENVFFTKVIRDGYEARKVASELNANPPAPKPLFAIAEAKPAAEVAKPAPRYSVVSDGEKTANVIDATDGDVVGHWFAEIAVEACQKLNAAEVENAKARPMFPVSAVAEPCWGCGANVITDGNIQPVKCSACHRMAADSALAELFSHAKALRDGTAPFDVLTASERAEQLSALIDVDTLPDATVIDLAADCAESIAARMHSVPEPIRVIEPSDDPIYVWDGEAPDAFTRFELEGRIEVEGVEVEPAEVLINFGAIAGQIGFNPRPAA